MFPPERIVCLTEETVETLYLLGEERRIVGISSAQGRWRCGMSLGRSHRACQPESDRVGTKDTDTCLTVVANLAAALEIPAKRSEADRVCCWRIPEVAPALTDFWSSA
jgi:hypothetical protein